MYLFGHNMVECVVCVWKTYRVICLDFWNFMNIFCCSIVSICIHLRWACDSCHRLSARRAIWLFMKTVNKYAYYLRSTFRRGKIFNAISVQFYESVNTFCTWKMDGWCDKWMDFDDKMTHSKLLMQQRLAKMLHYGILMLIIFLLDNYDNFPQAAQFDLHC